ncbi:MAG: hypothetical protein Alpg2KO_14340 [Alphaproteobacteria bacterium]
MPESDTCANHSASVGQTGGLIAMKMNKKNQLARSLGLQTGNELPDPPTRKGCRPLGDDFKKLHPVERMAIDMEEVFAEHNGEISLHAMRIRGWENADIATYGDKAWEKAEIQIKLKEQVDARQDN